MGNRCLTRIQEGSSNRDSHPCVRATRERFAIQSLRTAGRVFDVLHAENRLRIIVSPEMTSGKACGYTAVPTIAPMAAVTPIARAPQNTTRMVGLKASAPPVFAPIIPSKARKANDPTETIGNSQVDGEKRARMSGPAAPTENVAADASAA